MVILISGSSHTGKTNLAQKLLEKYHYPYLSIDHLKMGLIRSGNCTLTPESSDERLTAYLWPILCGIIRTVIENGQNLTIEGCYIPFDYRKDFEPEYAGHMKYVCLVFSDEYIQNHFDEIKAHANSIEKRLDDSFCTKELLLRENRKNLALCRKYSCCFHLIDQEYRLPEDLPL